MSDINLYYASYGNGTPVFFVHGGPGLDSTYMERACLSLSDQFHVIFHDQRCLGRSTGTPTRESLSLDHLIGDMELIRSQLALGKIHLVSHSWGTILAAHYACRYPHQIASLTLISPVSPDFDTAAVKRAQVLENMSPASRDALVALATSEAFLLGHPEAVRTYLNLWYQHTATKIPPLNPSELTCRQWARVHTLLLQQLPQLQLPGNLSSLTQPTLIISGSEDPCCSATPYLSIPGLRHETLAHCGHFPFLEAPEAFFPLLRAFLER